MDNMRNNNMVRGVLVGTSVVLVGAGLLMQNDKRSRATKHNGKKLVKKAGSWIESI